MLSPIGCNAFYCASFYGLSVDDLHCIDKHLAWQVVQQLEIAPVSDSLSVIKELLGIKFNSLYMPLLNNDEVMFIWILCVRRDDCYFSIFFFLRFF